MEGIWNVLPIAKLYLFGFYGLFNPDHLSCCAKYTMDVADARIWNGLCFKTLFVWIVWVLLPLLSIFLYTLWWMGEIRRICKTLFVWILRVAPPIYHVVQYAEWTLLVREYETYCLYRRRRPPSWPRPPLVPTCRLHQEEHHQPSSLALTTLTLLTTTTTTKKQLLHLCWSPVVGTTTNNAMSQVLKPHCTVNGP